MRPIAAGAFLLLFLWAPSPATRDSLSQEAPLDKILNPLAGYSPFEKLVSPSKFFPDEVDKRAGELLISAFIGGKDLEEHARFFSQKDRELKAERGHVTGMADHAADFLHNALKDRQSYLAAQKKALSSSPSPQRKKLLEWRLASDPLTQAEDLMRKSATNRWGAILNRLLSSVDLASIVSGSYIGAAMDTAMGQALRAGSSEISIEERRALVLYRQHLKRYPEDPRNPEIEKLAEKLEKKKKRVLVQEEIQQAQEASKKGDLDRARFHYQIASWIDPSDAGARNGLGELKRRAAELEKGKAKGLLAAEEISDASDQEEREGLLYALALGDPGEIERRAKALQERKAVADSARDALAVALEIRGKHEAAKEILKEISRFPESPHGKMRAESLLASPEYNLLRSFEEARRQRRIETARYVVLGGDLIQKNLLYAASPLVAGGPAAATSIAAANLLMIGTNLFQALTSNPISYEPVIDKGVAYIRSHPEAESSSEVYRILGEAYRATGRYDKAIAYLRLSGKASEKEIEDLRQKAGRLLLEAAGKANDPATREAYLRAVIAQYPETAAWEEATRKLAELMKPENRGLRVSKKFLMENPELYGPEGLGLKPTLFDGNLSNAELADRGLNLINDTEALFHFQTPWGIQSQTYTLEKERVSRFEIALRKKHHELALDDLPARPEGSTGGIRNLPPWILRGELARKKVEPADSSLSFVKEATDPEPGSPKVLSHELLSQSERRSEANFRLPQISGGLSPGRFDLRGSLPAGSRGDRLFLGTDEKSPFAGLELPLPIIQSFIPVDFLFQGRPGRIAVHPRIRTVKDTGFDRELYR